MRDIPSFKSFSTEDINRLLNDCRKTPPYFQDVFVGHLEHEATLSTIPLDEDNNLLIHVCEITTTNKVTNDKRITRYLNTSMGFKCVDKHQKMFTGQLRLESVVVFSELESFLREGQSGDYLLFRRLSTQKQQEPKMCICDGRQYKLKFMDDIAVGVML